MIIELISIGIAVICGYGLGWRVARPKLKALQAVTETIAEPHPDASFARLLEACGFRIFLHHGYNAPFDDGYLSIGERHFIEPQAEMHGWKIAYGLNSHAACCDGYYWWRLAQPWYREMPEVQMGENTLIPIRSGAGLGPRVCAKCGRIERDHDGEPDGIGGLLGRATNIFPVLHALTRRDGDYADSARLAMLERERQSLGDRRELVELEIAQLRKRLPATLGEGPYRSALPAGPEPETEEARSGLPDLKLLGTKTAP